MNLIFIKTLTLLIYSQININIFIMKSLIKLYIENKHEYKWLKIQKSGMNVAYRFCNVLFYVLPSAIW